jgi:N-methylhydantoinase A
LLDKAAAGDLERELKALDRQCAELMAIEGVAKESVTVQYFADVCYVGQSYHIEIPLKPGPDVIEQVRRDFYTAHDRMYGHSTEGPVKFVNLRSVHQARASGTGGDAIHVPAEGDPGKGARPILTEHSGGFVEAQVYERMKIRPGMQFCGPAIVEQADTTTVIEPGWRAEVDDRGNLILTQGELK